MILKQVRPLLLISPLSSLGTGVKILLLLSLTSSLQNFDLFLVPVQVRADDIRVFRLVKRNKLFICLLPKPYMYFER